jgi:repressor of nif and glnA expression
MIVAGGLNPLAAVEESNITTENIAMKSLFPFEDLIPFWKLNSAVRDYAYAAEG